MVHGAAERRTLKFGSTTEVLAKRMLQYYRSECAACCKRKAHSHSTLRLCIATLHALAVV